MIHKIYCITCKRTGIPLIMSSKNAKKTIQYYICRECNAQRQRKYTSTVEGKKRMLAIAKKSRENNPRKIMARHLVKYALMIGYIEKPTICSECGNTEKRIEGHHTDYEKALEVQWLCSTCHANIHRISYSEGEQ